MSRGLFVHSETGGSNEESGSLSVTVQWRGESVVFLGSQQLQLNKSFMVILSMASAQELGDIRCSGLNAL